MKNSKLKIFLRGLSLAVVMATGAAIVSIIGIECVVNVSEVAFNKFCFICVGGVTAFAGITGFTYEVKTAIDENKSFKNNIVEPQEEVKPELEGFTLTKSKAKDTTKSNIEPVIVINSGEIKREISPEKPREFVYKKETRKF